MQHTRDCLAKIGVEAEGMDGKHGQDVIFGLIAAIMHLLNVDFESGEDGLIVSQLDGISATSSLWWMGCGVAVCACHCNGVPSTTLGTYRLAMLLP